MLERLDQALAQARADALRFAVATVLLAPFALGLALAVLFFLLIGWFDLAQDLDLAGAAEPVALAVLGWFTIAAAARRPRHLDGYGFLLAPGAVLLALLGLVLVGGEGGFAHALFWLGALLALGLLGRAYAPRDDYYLGWAVGGAGIIDDPFTLRDDLDRAHVALGIAVALPNLVLESFAVAFASRALWRPLDQGELRLARSLLEPLLAGDREAASKALRAAPREPAAHVLRVLEAAKIVRAGGLALTEPGRRLIAAT